MSWSVNLIGKAAGIVEELKQESGRLHDLSKEEFDAACPHLIGLVSQNFAKDGSGYVEPILHLSASGSGYTKDGEPQHRQCSVKLDVIYGKLV